MHKLFQFLILLCMPALLWAQPLVQLKGPLLQGSMMVKQAPVGSKITLDNTHIEQTADGLFVFGFDRDAAAKMQLSVITAEGEQWQKTLEIKPREYRIQRIEGIKPSIVSSDKTEAEWQRIREESQQITKARKQRLELTAFAQEFSWPVIGRISGVFDSQRVYNGKPGRPHYGVDIAMPTGTPVYAPADGVVTLAHDDMYYSGGTLIVDHGYGISSSFLHLSKVEVEVGTEVKQGDLIALVGAGGQATGPHLDWRMNWYGQRIDPQLLVPDMQTLLQQQEQKK